MAQNLDQTTARELLPLRDDRQAKWHFGRTALVCGSAGMSGAALLATQAALRSGAGLVQLCSVAEVINATRTVAPEALLLPVARQDYNKPLAVLAGLDAESGVAQPYAGGTLGGHMIVLCGVDRRLDEILNALRRAGVGPECLKAVLTPHNRSWSAVMLYGELLREHREMQGK